VRTIDDDREEMQKLAAERKREIFEAPREGTLSVQDNPDFDKKLEGLEEGYIDVVIRARGVGGPEFFYSRSRTHIRFIDEYEDDLRRGMDYVLHALRDFSRSKETESGVQR
jgi:hypothetical protein